MAQLNFNAEGVDTTSQFDALPAGDYVAMVTDSASKATKDGTGSYLELTMQIQEGQFHGRKIFDRLNLKNKNPKAVEIAQKQLAMLCHATGIMQVNDSEQLHYKPIVVKLGVKENTYNGSTSLQNEVKGYKAKAANAAQAGFSAPRAQAPATAVAPTAQAPAPTSGGLPWKKAA